MRPLPVEEEGEMNGMRIVQVMQAEAVTLNNGPMIDDKKIGSMALADYPVADILDIRQQVGR